MRTKNPMAKKPQQILFSKNKYGSKVKVQNWDYELLAEKKDNYIYRDHLSNYTSTYTRWGSQDQNIGQSETGHMLAQVFTKTEPVYAFKPLVNFTSYPCTDTPGRNKLMKDADLAQLPIDFGVMDYLTTQQNDFRNPFPTVMKPSMVYSLHSTGWSRLEVAGSTQALSIISAKIDTQMAWWMRRQFLKLTMASPPFLLNRVIRSDLTHNHSAAPPSGDYQCLDTHTPIGHIRKMRLFRYQSFNPATCDNFPFVTLNLEEK